MAGLHLTEFEKEFKRFVDTAEIWQGIISNHQASSLTSTTHLSDTIAMQKMLA